MALPSSQAFLNNSCLLKGVFTREVGAVGTLEADMEPCSRYGELWELLRVGQVLEASKEEKGPLGGERHLAPLSFLALPQSESKGETGNSHLSHILCQAVKAVCSSLFHGCF